MNPIAMPGQRNPCRLRPSSPTGELGRSGITLGIVQKGGAVSSSEGTVQRAPPRRAHESS
eukprot:1451350-Prymnesium_polylepis.1